MVLGKHSGLSAIVTALSEQGLEVSPDRGHARLVASIKAHAQHQSPRCRPICCDVSIDRVAGSDEHVGVMRSRNDARALPH